MISLILENPLYLFADDPTLCRDISHHSDRQAAASPFSSDLDKNHKLVKYLECLSILINPTLTLSLQKDRTVNPPI